MAYAEAKHLAASEIPVIDVGPLADGSSGGLRSVARAMRQAAESIGFFYVANHGIPDDLIRRTDAVARTFFACPESEKQRVRPLDRHRGFLSVGEAKMYRNARADLKESYIWGLEVGEDDPDYRAGNRMIGPNRWPAFLPEMRGVFNAFFAAGNACGQRLLRAFAVSLDADPEYFTRSFAKPITRCSAIYYPPQPPDAGEDQFGVAAHTDYGTLTLLRQDEVGGLQVLSRQNEWVTAHPIPGTLVVNVGDLLARWTNDRFRSNAHRVVNRSGRERLSLGAFVDPDFATEIRPVVQPGETPRHEPVRCGDYILGRLDAAFAYRQKG